MGCNNTQLHQGEKIWQLLFRTKTKRGWVAFENLQHKTTTAVFRCKNNGKDYPLMAYYQNIAIGVTYGRFILHSVGTQIVKLDEENITLILLRG